MRKTTSPGVLFALLASALLGGCAASGADPLDGTTWVLASLDGAAPLSGRSITLTFEADEVHGSSGCNTYFGSYAVSGDTLNVTGLMWTEMACVEQGWMEQESAYLSRLAAARSISLAGDRLQILSGDGSSLTFASQR